MRPWDDPQRAAVGLDRFEIPDELDGELIEAGLVGVPQRISNSAINVRNHSKYVAAKLLRHVAEPGIFEERGHQRRIGTHCRCHLLGGAVERFVRVGTVERAFQLTLAGPDLFRLEHLSEQEKAEDPLVDRNL